MTHIEIYDYYICKIVAISFFLISKLAKQDKEINKYPPKK